MNTDTTAHHTILGLGMLQERGLYPTAYPGVTLRENLGVPAQYGLDPRTTRRIDHGEDHR